MATRSLLLLAFGLLLTACAASSQAAPVAEVPLDGDTNVAALDAAEKGELGTPTIVFFHADWCLICQKARPSVEELAAKYEGEVAVVRMNIDDAAARAAVARYDVSSTPTFVLLSAQGTALASIPGWPGKEDMERTIAQMMASSQ